MPMAPVGGTYFMTGTTDGAIQWMTATNITLNTTTTGWHPYTPPISPGWYPVLSRTNEEMAERMVAARARREEQARVRELAGDRARATLLSLLNAEQRDMFEEERSVVVEGSAGGRYRIGPGYQQNITDIAHAEQGGRRYVLCAHPQMRVEGGVLPEEDAMIAQLLMLRFDEPGFLAIANRS